MTDNAAMLVVCYGATVMIVMEIECKNQFLYFMNNFVSNLYSNQFNSL